MTTRQITIIFVACILVISNGIIDYYYRVFGTLLTPILLVIISFLIAFKLGNIGSITKAILLFGLIVLNDLLLQLSRLENRERDCFGISHIFLFIGLIPTFIILIKSIYRDKESNQLTKIIGALILPVFIPMYLFFF